MIKQISEQSVIYFLPVPISAGDNGRLGAVVYSSAQTNLANVPKLLINFLPERILPSPSYLFAQGLDPNLLRNGLKERNFVEQIRKLIKEHIIITWDARLLNLLDVAAIDCFKQPLLQDCKGIVSIRTLLYAACFFGNLHTPPFKSLEKSARLYKKNLSNIQRSPKRRLLELKALSLMLEQDQKALFYYQLRGRTNKINLLNDALSNNTLLSCVNDDGQCGILRILRKVNDAYIGGFLNCLTDENVQLLVINEHGGEILAPIGVFTKERCIKLNFNLHFYSDVLLKYVLPQELDCASFVSQHSSPLQKFLASLTVQEQNFYSEACTNKEVPQDLNNLSASMSQRLFLYLGDQVRGELNAEQYKRYESICKNYLQKQYNSYMQEAGLLVNHADENSESDANLMHSIAIYPSTL